MVNATWQEVLKRVWNFSNKKPCSVLESEAMKKADKTWPLKNLLPRLNSDLLMKLTASTNSSFPKSRLQEPQEKTWQNNLKAKKQSKRYQITTRWKELWNKFKTTQKSPIHSYQFSLQPTLTNGRYCFWVQKTLPTKMDCSYCMLSSPTITHSELQKWDLSHQFTTATWTLRVEFATVCLTETIHQLCRSRTLLNVFMDWFWHLNQRIHWITWWQVSIWVITKFIWRMRRRRLQRMPARQLKNWWRSFMET